MFADQTETSEVDILEANLRIRPKPKFHVAVYQNIIRFAKNKPLAFSGGAVLALMIILLI